MINVDPLHKSIESKEYYPENFRHRHEVNFSKFHQRFSGYVSYQMAAHAADGSPWSRQVEASSGEFS